MHRRVALAALTCLLCNGAAAQPARPIRLVVPYPAGGPLDLAARALAEGVRDSLGTVVVDNRPGAGGNLGADIVAKAAQEANTQRVNVLIRQEFHATALT